MFRAKAKDDLIAATQSYGGDDVPCNSMHEAQLQAADPFGGRWTGSSQKDKSVNESWGDPESKNLETRRRGGGHRLNTDTMAVSTCLIRMGVGITPSPELRPSTPGA